MPAVILAAPGPVFIDSNQQSVKSNATITATGSQVYSGFGTKQLTLVVNIKAAPTGTSPTLMLTMQEVDPGDGATTFGPVVSTAALNTIGVTAISLPTTMGGSVKVTWTVGGSSTPTFTQVYVTLQAKTDGPMVGQDSTGADRTLLMDASGRAVVAGAGLAGALYTSSPTISNVLSKVLDCLERIEQHLAAMSDEHVTNENGEDR